MAVNISIVSLIGLRDFLGVLSVPGRMFPGVLDHEGCVLINANLLMDLKFE